MGLRAGNSVVKSIMINQFGGTSRPISTSSLDKLLDTGLYQVTGQSFDFSNFNDRVKLGKSMVNELYNEE